MAANAAADYVVPAGVGALTGIFGPGFGKHNYPSPDQGMFQLPGDERGAYGPPTDAWNAQRLGLGVLPLTGQLGGALYGSTNRFAGDPNGAVNPANGLPQGGWSDRWQQWFGTDVQDPNTGQLLLSPQHQTGLRVGQDYGVRDDQGGVIGPASGDIFKGFTYAQNQLSKNPYLDPTQALGGYRGMATSQPYGTPDPNAYLAMMQQAGGAADTDRFGQRGLRQVEANARNTNFDQYGMQGVADTQGLNAGTNFDRYGRQGMRQTEGIAGDTNFDQYGLRGIQQTNDLAGANLRQLTRGIDQESQNTLAMQLPEVQQAFEAAGMGRSGAGGLAMLQAQNDILSQANRDKQRTMADFTDREANRQAGAINLASQQGYGGEGQKYGSLANMISQMSQQGMQGGMQQYGSLANMIAQASQQGFAGQGQKYGSISDAMNLGSQIGAQGAEGAAGRQGQAVMAGLQNQFGMGQSQREGEQALWQQAMDQQSQRYGQDTSNYLGALQAGGQYTLGGLQAEQQGQSSAFNDYMNLVNQREGWRSNSMNEMLGLADQERSIRQERLNQQLAASNMPLDLMMRIATGTTAPSGPQPGRTSPWGMVGPAVAAEGLGSLFGGAGEKGANYLADRFGQF